MPFFIFTSHNVKNPFITIEIYNKVEFNLHTRIMNVMVVITRISLLLDRSSECLRNFIDYESTSTISTDLIKKYLMING